MTYVLVTLAAAVLLAAAVGTAVMLGRRSRRLAEERIAAAVTDMNTRMESMVLELRQALERAEEDTRRSRILGDVAASLDLDDVLTRVLEATAEIAGADAALVSLDDAANGKPLVATLGLSPDEAERQGAITGPPGGGPARAITIEYRYDDDELAPEGAVIHAGLAVPIPGERAPGGYLAIFTRTAGRAFGDAEVVELEQIATRAAPAIENARRFREARQLADEDALTRLHNRRYFHEVLGREVARAHRYRRDLALAVYDLDGFKAVNDRVGHLEGDAVLAEVADRIRSVVRAADIACRVGGDEFAVILPESTLADAEQLSRRVQEAVAARPVGIAGQLSVSAGVAELRPEDDSRSFFERADGELYRAKGTANRELGPASGNGGGP